MSVFKRCKFQIQYSRVGGQKNLSIEEKNISISDFAEHRSGQGQQGNGHQ